jgi:3(or 17)beta-hydroxysteroid dehydrogenase
MNRVEGKVVIITGAASGVGREDARLLASEGARVVLTDINEQGGRAVSDEIGEGAIFVRHDIAVEEDWTAVMKTTIERFGRLDAVVNNAAILMMGSIEDTSLEDWRKVHRVNADGYFLGCKYAVAGMKNSGGGSIVNMSSVAALTGIPIVCAYSGSKGSVAALTRSVAVHCRLNGYRIRCNSIHPDGILTPMTLGFLGNDIERLRIENDPASRFCDPKDVANLVLFLVSEESRFINGAELRIDNAQMVVGL